MMINIHIQVMPLYLLDLGPAHFKRLNYTSPMQTKEPDLGGSKAKVSAGDLPDLRRFLKGLRRP